MTTETKNLIRSLTVKANESNMTLREAASLAGIDPDKTMSWMKGLVQLSDSELQSLCKQLNFKYSKTETVSGSDKKNATQQTEEPKKEKKTRQPKQAKADRATPETEAEEVAPEKDVKTNADTPVPQEDSANEQLSLPLPAPEKAPEPKKMRKSKSKAASKERNMLSEESESFIRSLLSLKKSEAITEKHIQQAYHVATCHITDTMRSSEKLTKELTIALKESSDTKPPVIDERYKMLMAAAEKASDEGIELAVTILKKFKK